MTAEYETTRRIPHLERGDPVWLATHWSRLIRFAAGRRGPRRRLLPTAPKWPDTFGVVAGPMGTRCWDIAACICKIIHGEAQHSDMM